MLSESSYHMALYIYVGSACLILLCMGWWLGRRWSAGWASLAVLLLAALLLTPAFPRTEVSTMAPALVVAVFAYFTDGYEAAEHALRPLGVMCILALGVAALLQLTLFRGLGARSAAAAKVPAK